MGQISLQFEFSNQVEREQVAKQIEDRMRALEAVQDVKVDTGQARFPGAETVAVVAVAIVVSKSGRQLSEELRKWLAEVKNWIRDVRDLKAVWVNVGYESVPIAQMTEAHVEKLANAAERKGSPRKRKAPKKAA